MKAKTTAKTPKTSKIKREKLDPRTIAKEMRRVRTGIVLTGYVRNGKVELDQETLDELAKKFANANTAFVAVNAPFDPKSGIE